jgi:hypothetical protein
VATTASSLLCIALSSLLMYIFSACLTARLVNLAQYVGKLYVSYSCSDATPTPFNSRSMIHSFPTKTDYVDCQFYGIVFEGLTMTPCAEVMERHSASPLGPWSTDITEILCLNFQVASHYWTVSSALCLSVVTVVLIFHYWRRLMCVKNVACSRASHRLRKQPSRQVTVPFLMFVSKSSLG